MTADDFTTAARAEAEALVADIIRWDDTVATDGPCDGTWDSLAAYLAGRGWARAHLAAQEPTEAEVLAALNADYAIRHPLTSPSDTLDDYGDWPVSMMRATLRAARDVRGQG